MKFAKGSLAVQEETGKKFPSSFTSWGSMEPGSLQPHLISLNLSMQS